jgi:DEAD/DEAH box helicase domain-containing protein
MQIPQMLARTGARVVHAWSEPGRKTVYAEIPAGLAPQLRLLLKLLHPEGLYSHQAKSLEASLGGKHVGICTSTASGKSLCFTLPAANELLRDRNSRAIFLYPNKALSNDQTQKLTGFLSFLRLGGLVKKLDGDVVGEERKKAVAAGRVLLSTPDVLHTSMLRLNREPGYEDIFKNLKYVVLDECHVYNGVFGSNMAYVLRRLRQVCENLGANPLFIMASATSGNPSAHLKMLTGLEEITLISEEDNGSPSRGRDYFLAEPPPDSVSITYLARLAEEMCLAGKKFLVFCHSRQAVENYYLGLSGLSESLKEKIMPYRSGYEASDRTKIENALRNGALSGVFCTSALELGIDLPDLDTCLMLGLPGTKISFIQRAGRVGRSKKGSVIILKTGGAQDEYYFSRPRELVEKGIEPLNIHLQNRQIILSHYACARLECGDFENSMLNEQIFGSHFKEIEKRVRDFDFPDEILYHQSPHFEVQIRNINDPSYSILLGKNGDAPVIGTISYSQVLREAYPGAIYGHMGRRYRVEKISYSKRQVFVNSKCPQGVTRPAASVFVKPRPGTSQEYKNWEGISVSRCFISVIERVDGYVERVFGKKTEVAYRQPLMRYFVTSGVEVSLRGMESLTHGAVMGLATALENAYTFVFPCAREDFGVHAWVRTGEEGRICFFDNAAGGIGLTWPMADFFERMVSIAAETVENCPNCRDGQEPDHSGCVNCIASTRLYGHMLKGNRQETIRLVHDISAIIEGQPDFISGNAESAWRTKEGASVKRQAGFGQTMIAQGSLVFTGRCQEGLVSGSKPFIEKGRADRIYDILVDGETFHFLGSSLSLIQGQLERWCANCGEESIDMLAVRCPVCGEPL